jgi:hypothetical protein
MLKRGFLMQLRYFYLKKYPEPESERILITSYLPPFGK